jgi:hypothetical protein
VFVHGGEDALDIGPHLVEAGRRRRNLRAQFRDVKTERRSEDAGALARLQHANGVLELLHHMAYGKFAKIAAVIFAVGMALGDFGEGLAALQFRQGHLYPRLSLLLRLKFINVLYDVSGTICRRLKKVLALRVVECLHVLGAGLCRAGYHLMRGALGAKLELQHRADLRVLEDGAQAGGLLALTRDLAVD